MELRLWGWAVPGSLKLPRLNQNHLVQDALLLEPISLIAAATVLKGHTDEVYAAAISPDGKAHCFC